MLHAKNEKEELSPAQESLLWQRLLHDRDDSVRQKLITHYLPLARKNAAILFARRPGSNLEFSDYMQWAVIGLLEAVDKYDPTQNASFATYASYRMRGAVLNGVEKTSERTAQYGFKKRIRRERLESLSKGETETPTSDLFMEMVDAAIGLALGYMLEDSGMYHHGDESSQHDDPYKCLEIKRLSERFRFVVEALPEKEKLVVQYHYFQGINFNVIATMLGVTKGRVSQIHSRALKLIRDAYKSLDQFDVKY
jgi:RNA polymerase sigma factor for flagellar operon FliA